MVLCHYDSMAPRASLRGTVERHFFSSVPLFLVFGDFVYGILSIFYNVVLVYDNVRLVKMFQTVPPNMAVEAKNEKKEVERKKR